MAKETKKSAKEQAVTPAVKGEVSPAAPSRALSPFEEMDRMFDTFFSRGWMRPFGRDWPSWGEMMAPLAERMPRVDVIDRNEEVIVRAEVPGVDKDDIDVSLSDNAVTIKGATSHEEKEEKGDYYRCETRRGSFSRTVTLPAAVDGSKAKAKFKDGVLELTLPKTGGARRRSIKVE